LAIKPVLKVKSFNLPGGAYEQPKTEPYSELMNILTGILPIDKSWENITQFVTQTAGIRLNPEVE